MCSESTNNMMLLRLSPNSSTRHKMLLCSEIGTGLKLQLYYHYDELKHKSREMMHVSFDIGHAMGQWPSEQSRMMTSNMETWLLVLWCGFDHCIGLESFFPPHLKRRSACTLLLFWHCAHFWALCVAAHWHACIAHWQAINMLMVISIGYRHPAMNSDVTM